MSRHDWPVYLVAAIALMPNIASADPVGLHIGMTEKEIRAGKLCPEAKTDGAQMTCQGGRWLGVAFEVRLVLADSKLSSVRARGALATARKPAEKKLQPLLVALAKEWGTLEMIGSKDRNLARALLDNVDRTFAKFKTQAGMMFNPKKDPPTLGYAGGTVIRAEEGYFVEITFRAR